MIEHTNCIENKMVTRLNPSLENITGKNLSWVIMLFNKVIDPFYGVSLSTVGFDNLFVRSMMDKLVFVSSGFIFSWVVRQCWHHCRFVISKTTNDDGSISYSREPRGTIKSIDNILGSVQLTQQSGDFKKDDTLAILVDRVEVLSATVQKVVDSAEAVNYFAERLEGSRVIH